MTDWVTIALSGGSACLGGGLTMLGQFLADGRSSKRGQEARREEFQIANFEIQRSALLELQDVVVQVSGSVRDVSLGNKARGIIKSLLPGNADVMEWYQIDEQFPELINRQVEMSRLKSEFLHVKTLSEDRRREFASRADELADYARKIAGEFERAKDYLADLTGKMDRINLLSARTGNDEVVAHCRELVKLVDRWTAAKNAEDSELRARDVEDVTDQTLTVISRALRFGPFSQEKLLDLDSDAKLE